MIIFVYVIVLIKVKVTEIPSYIIKDIFYGFYGNSQLLSCPAWETVSFLCLTSLRQQFPWSLRSCLPWDKIDCSSQCPGICVITVLICYIKPLFYGFMGNSQTVSWGRGETLGNYCPRLRVTVFPQYFPQLKNNNLTFP